ncbi:hypothetical protein [Ferrimicrobium sp.]|uniref:hypothetical protein n=1 Tax=Ferrimicrobium sp. TaxID=2926050 RepID=UPI00260594F4|nr:hypothetical protein [Ferrimicrobium sp.]
MTTLPIALVSYLTVSLNVVRSQLVPRIDRSSLLRIVIPSLTIPGQIIRPRVRHYENRDRALAFEKPISLLVLLRAWVLGYLFALGLLMLPSAQNPLAALAQAG